MVRETLLRLNAARAEAGLPVLELDARLMQAAELHAEFMAETATLSHVGRGDSRFDERIISSLYLFETAAENVAAGAEDAASVVALWMESPPHRANILNASFCHAGIGIAKSAGGTRYWSLSLAAPVAGAR